MPQPNDKCRKCPYSQAAPGSSHHLECHYSWITQPEPAPAGDEHGKRNGWWLFPINFDPIWMVGECTVEAAERDPDKTMNPFLTVAMAMKITNRK